MLVFSLDSCVEIRWDGIAVDANRLASVIERALQRRDKTIGDAPGSDIVRCDAADERGPSKPPVGVVAGAPCRFRLVAETAAARSQPPHHLGLRPAIRVPQPAVADPVPGRLLLQRPRAIAAQ